MNCVAGAPLCAQMDIFNGEALKVGLLTDEERLYRDRIALDTALIEFKIAKPTLAVIIASKEMDGVFELERLSVNTPRDKDLLNLIIGVGLGNSDA